MNIIEINSWDDPRLDAYARLTEAQLRNRLEPEKGLFIAESPKVITRALAAGMQPLSFLMERQHLTAARTLIEGCTAEDGSDIPVFTGSTEILSRLTGFELTRGVLCAMRRPALPSVEDLLANARRVAVLEGIVDQCGGCFSIGSGTWYRCGFGNSYLLRSALSPISSCFYGHSVSGTLDSYRPDARRLA